MIKKCLVLVAGFAVAIAVAAGRVDARGGGGHGGGHGGGGHHGGADHHGGAAGHHAEHRGGHHAEHHANHPADHRANHEPNRNRNAGRHEPFSPLWYANHPNAWRHPHADAAAVATWDATAGWLGLEGGYVDDGSYGTTTYVEPSQDTADSDTSTGQASNSDQSDTDTAAAADQGSDNIGLIDNAYAEAQGKWLPLGIYSVDGAAKSNVLHLAVDRDGELRGNQFDPATDKVEPLAGKVDKTTHRATWTVGGKSYEANLRDLAEGRSTVTARSASGETTSLTLIRQQGVGAIN